MKYDVVVHGGTPAGIASAIASARFGRRVAHVERHLHLGGMAASGLGKSDVEKPEYIGGIFREFTQRVHRYYLKKYGANSPSERLCRSGYYYEPHVAETVFNEMVCEQNGIDLFLGHRLESAEADTNTLRTIALVDTRSGDDVQLEASVFIDASYEGDLYAAAGAAHRLGRESREEHSESLAGYIYYDYENGEILPGTTGEADGGLPAYTYRLCLTTSEERSVHQLEPPPDYDRQTYTPYFEDLEAGRLSAPKVMHAGRGYHPDHFDTLTRALSVTEMPNESTDVNINPRPLAFPFAEENADYVEGSWDSRLAIESRHRNLALGLLWFLQHDGEVPQAHRDLALRYHLPRNEFVDNGHFPWQLYIREARRLIGCYTITEHDVSIVEGAEASRPDDTIAMGEFPIDSFPVHKKQASDTVVLEGYLGMLGHLTRPYYVPYRAMLPETVDGIIVPGALSATHVAYSSIRMEPTWMALGQAAGVAAHLALKGECPARAVPIKALQKLLEDQGQVLRPPGP